MKILLLLSAALLQASETVDLWSCGDTDALKLTLIVCPSDINGGKSATAMIRGTSVDGPRSYNHAHLRCVYRSSGDILTDDCQAFAEDEYTPYVTVSRVKTPTGPQVWARIFDDEVDQDEVLLCRRSTVDVNSVLGVRKCEPLPCDISP